MTHTNFPHPFDQFVWAGGIENTFVPDARPGLRSLEEYELTQHYQQWRSDFDRAASLGIKALRWGPPWYRTEAKQGEFNWDFADEAIDYIVNVLKITPIVDLVHYGTPDWLEGGFANPDYPERVAAYTTAFVKRYKHLVRFYTPLNEPTVTADFSGRRGEWPPYLKGDTGYVSILLQLARGIQHTAKAIRAEQPEAILVAVEAMRRVKPERVRAGAAAKLRALHEYLPYDLAAGRVNDSHPLRNWLLESGASQDVLAQLVSNGVEHDIFGVNFYPWSYAEVDVDDSGNVTSTDGRCTGNQLFHVLKEAYEHSGKPLMITETSATGTMAQRKRWMQQTTSAVAKARRSGVKVCGYTWFPLFTMIGWEYRTSEKPIDEHLLHLGLWDCHFDSERTLVREETPMVAKYKSLIASDLMS